MIKLKKSDSACKLNIGLDIDGVLCNHIQGIIDGLEINNCNKEFPKHWSLISSLKTKFAPKEIYDRLRKTPNFWTGMKTFELPFFKPKLYCTSRGFHKAAQITRNWMKLNKVPLAPIHCIGDKDGGKANKGTFLLRQNINVFVEDDEEHWNDINDVGILCLLIDRPWNRHVDAGFSRIFSLKEVKKKANEILNVM